MIRRSTSPWAAALALALAFPASLRALAPAGRYTLNGTNDVVNDTKTQLHWERNPPSQTYTHAQAASRCAGLTLGGLSWRLPSKIELDTLVDFNAINPPIDVGYFPGTSTVTPYWTSTSYQPAPTQFWAMLFDYPSEAPVDGGTASLVRCVS